MLALVWIPLTAGAADARGVKKLLARPPREFATAPLWVWNDQLTAAQIRGTLQDLASQGVRQAFVHPRPGLMTPYLGNDWFRLWRVALDEAKKRDMNIWIYDENSYPSGFAGGFVPELMPEARGRGLSIQEAKAAPAWSEKLIAVYRQQGESCVNVSARVKAGESMPAGTYFVATETSAGNSPWHGDRCYVNLLTPGVTEKFLEITLGAYERELGSELGHRIPGIFTDEPNIRPASGLPWCADLPTQFQQRWGYHLLDCLPSLVRPVGDWRKVRHDFYHTLNALFIERWAKPYHDRCEKDGLEWTGHYWDHEWPHCVGVPDNMAMYAWHQRPSIDCLMNQYAENTHAQFGNVRMVREMASIANQLGRSRTLCEIYGAGGWDLRFEDMKRIGDWLGVLGVNTFDEHLSYVTLRGARKRDHPQSFSYHEPWWEAYHVNAEYLTRLSAVISQGEQINRTLVIEPTTTAWMYQGDEPALKKLGDEFVQFLMGLEAAQVEYDLGCEDVMAREAKVEGKQLRVGRRLYDRVVIPPGTENLGTPVWNLLHSFMQASQRNLLAAEAPIRRDGKLMNEGDASKAWDWQLLLYRPDELLAVLKTPVQTPTVAIQRQAGDKGILFHQRRHLDDGEILLLVNTSIDTPSAGEIQSSLRGVEAWDLYTGRPRAHPFAATPAGVQTTFELPPSGSLVLFFSERSMRPVRPMECEVKQVEPAGATEIRRTGPNVLTLDYVDVTAGGETKSNVYFYQGNQFVWQKNGLARDPWDSAVQFKEELVSKSFPAESGFSATYRFTVDGAVPSDLAIVVERTDLYQVTCNGRPVHASPGDWWLDKAFRRIPLGAVARPGENTVTLTARPFTMFHELEPAYVLGDFALRSAERGFVIVSPQPLRMGQQREAVAGGSPKRNEGVLANAGLGWNQQGAPFYAQGVSYQQHFRVPRRQGEYRVKLPSWYGSAARVTVNGKAAGYITAPPWECEVTSNVRAGDNTVEIVVYGTLKNTLGPHHTGQALGSAWPGMFQNGPKDGQPAGQQYHTLAYGLFAPMELWQSSKR